MAVTHTLLQKDKKEKLCDKDQHKYMYALLIVITHVIITQESSRLPVHGKFAQVYSCCFKGTKHKTRRNLGGFIIKHWHTCCLRQKLVSLGVHWWRTYVFPFLFCIIQQRNKTGTFMASTHILGAEEIFQDRKENTTGQLVREGLSNKCQNLRSNSIKLGIHLCYCSKRRQMHQPINDRWQTFLQTYICIYYWHMVAAHIVASSLSCGPSIAQDSNCFDLTHCSTTESKDWWNGKILVMQYRELWRTVPGLTCECGGHCSGTGRPANSASVG